jgi:phosphate transport system substrate-binding protein
MNMKKFGLITVLVLCVMIVCTNCDKDDIIKSTVIEGLTINNYPKVDGSTSARALNTMVACKLLGVDYEWSPPTMGFPPSPEWYVSPKNIPNRYKNFFEERIKTSQTHGAFMNLIDGKADIIVTHRSISPDEKAHADAVGVLLLETSIASDAFVFVVHKNNPVKSLTVEQVQKIYTQEITNWSEVGGNNADIRAFARPRNSGSEEVFRELVMKDLEPAHFQPDVVINPMYGVISIFVSGVENGICYTFKNYQEVIARVPDTELPNIAINGISPNEDTVKNGIYPFISKVHVAIRSDLDRNSMAYKLYEWLQSENAKSTIEECGFITK